MHIEATTEKLECEYTTNRLAMAVLLQKQLFSLFQPHCLVVFVSVCLFFSCMLVEH